MAYEFRPIGNETEEDRMLNELMISPVSPNLVEIGPDKFILSNGYDEKVANGIKKFEVRNEDILLAAYPKTGSTWLHETVFLISNDLNYDKITDELQFIRLPCIEGNGINNLTLLKKFLQGAGADVDAWEAMNTTRFNKQNPRNLKTHLYYSLLPEQIRNETKMPKIIVSLRNPHDVCVSYYHYSKTVFNYKGTFEQFCQLFMAGKVYFGNYWTHVKSYWEQRHRPNILFIKYSEMKSDYPGVIRKVAKFLEKKLSDDDIAKLAEYLSFENMKKNPKFNGSDIKEKFLLKDSPAFTEIVRAGLEGGYKNVMSPEMIKKFDAWVEENSAGTGITF